jgi:hypothetical protein
VTGVRRGALALAAGIALFFAIDRFAFGFADPWALIAERIPPRYRAEIGVIDDQITYLRMAARAEAGESRVFVLGTSRARAAFRPETLAPTARPDRFGVVAHAGMMPFEMRSQLGRLVAAPPAAVVIFLSEFELFHPLHLNPWLATGEFDATFELARAAGPTFVIERRETFARLAAVGLLDTYRFRIPLGRAGLDALHTFPTDARVPNPRPAPILYPPGSGPDFESAKQKLKAAFDQHLEPAGALAARFEMVQVASLVRGEDARIQARLLRSLIAGLRASGAAVIVIDLPIFPGAEALYDPALRQEFRAFAAGLQNDFGARIVARDELPKLASSDFIDLTHVGASAATRLTRRVSEIVSETLAP